VAFHSPCSLQHGLQIRGMVEALLVSAGFELTMVPDSHLCCGSAGTYSILQPELSRQLLKNKVDSLESGEARVAGHGEHRLPYPHPERDVAAGPALDKHPGRKVVMTKTAMITGATAGFGAAAVRRFANAGWRVIATGRRADRLKKLVEEFGTEKVFTLVLRHAQTRTRSKRRWRPCRNHSATSIC
jgi:hypothetical protein